MNADGTELFASPNENLIRYCLKSNTLKSDFVWFVWFDPFKVIVSQ